MELRFKFMAQTMEAKFSVKLEYLDLLECFKFDTYKNASDDWTSIYIRLGEGNEGIEVMKLNKVNKEYVLDTKNYLIYSETVSYTEKVHRVPLRSIEVIRR